MMVCRRVAPVAWMASMGPGSMPSMASEYSLPSAATECTVSATIPAKGPSPTQTTAMSAQISGSMARITFMTVRVSVVDGQRERRAGHDVARGRGS